MPPVVHGTRVLALVSLLGAAACKDSVVLGGECRPLGATCVKAPGGDGDDGQLTMDAGHDAARPHEAGSPTDTGPVERADAARADASSAADAAPSSLGPLPDIQNPSFEVTGGPATGGTLGGLSGTTIDPWTWCGGTVEIKAADGALVPTEGMTFAKLTLTAGPGMIVQTLAAPMMKDTQYALAVDVATSQTASNAKLTIAAYSGACVPGTVLGVTPTIPAGAGWQTYCFVFTPKSDMSQLMLQGATNLGGVVYVDNLREAKGCTPEPPP